MEHEYRVILEIPITMSDGERTRLRNASVVIADSPQAAEATARPILLQWLRDYPQNPGRHRDIAEIGVEDEAMFTTEEHVHFPQKESVQ